MKNTEKRMPDVPSAVPTRLPILLCWLAYTSAYLGRYSYSSNITAIMGDFGVGHGDTGLVTTCFFFAYGAGQVVHGLLCRYYPAKYMVPFALTLSALLNLTVFFGVPFSWLKYLWLANGLLQSILWPTLISSLSRVLQDNSLTKAVVAMSTTVPAGTFLIYGLSALLVTSGRYRVSFLAAAIAMLFTAAGWVSFYGKAFPSVWTQRRSGSDHRAEKGRRALSGAVLAAVVLLGIFAVANNLVKDGLTTWVPAILKEGFGLQEGLSIFLTLLLPMLGLLGAVCNTLLEKRIPSPVVLSGVWFLLTTLCLTIVAWFLHTEFWVIVLLAFGCVSLFMQAVNNVITSMTPLYMRGQMDSGMLAGLLNGCCYVGSAVSSYGLGTLADFLGWEGVILFLLGMSAVPAVISLIYCLLSRKSRRGY